MSGSFEKAYEKWMNEHIKKRRGERLSRLENGHGFAEKLLLQEECCGSLVMILWNDHAQ